MKLLLKRAIVIPCVVIGFFGIIYKVTVLPFSSPMFDLISWIRIGVAAVTLAYVGSWKYGAQVSACQWRLASNVSAAEKRSVAAP